MFIIEARRDDRKWISGVFLTEDDATSFCATIPEQRRDWQRVYEVSFARYPVYLIETDIFRFVNRDDAIQAIRSIQRVRDDEVVYFNLYRFASDYVPVKPGTDYMGNIVHHHIDNRALDDLQRPDQEYFQHVFPE